MNQDPRAAFAGQIADVPVVELLQTILQGGHTGVARFETPVGAATLWFRDGALIDADMGRHHMEAAVQRLLALDGGTFEVEFKPITRRAVIKASTAELIAQAPARPGVPTAMPVDDSDADNEAARKRARRQGVSWHPTGGGRGKQDASGALSIVLPPGMKPVRGTAVPAPPVVGPPTAGVDRTVIAPPPTTADRTVIAPPRLADAGSTMVAPRVTATPSAAQHDEGRVSGLAPTMAMPAVSGVASPSTSASPPPRPAGPSVIAGSSAAPATASSAPAVPPIVIGSTPTPSAAPPTRGHTPFDPPSSGTRRTMFGVPVVAPSRTESGESSAVAPMPSAPSTRVLPPPVEEPEATDRTLMRAGPVPPPRGVQPPSVARNPAMLFVPAPPPAAVDGPAPTLHFEQQPAQWTHVGSTQSISVQVPTPMGGAPLTHAEIPPALGVPAPVAANPSGPLPSPVPIESGQTAAAHGEIRRSPRALPPAPSWSPSAASVPAAPPPDPNVDKIVVTPEVMAGQTMTAGSAARGHTQTTPVRPGGARRTEERAAVVAQAIGMSPPQPADRRAVSDGVRLDQQVEAARAAGLTGASAPAVVGRYEVLLRIARGGMGTVYLARITGEGGFRRLFALKVIRDHLSQNDEYVRMLLQEARIASRLHHPNVVGIVDIGTLANQHYLVMDYVEGCTFSELLKVHRRTRPPHLIIPIIIEALTGLHAAHALVDDDGSPLTLVHCDFSPQNMLVGTNGICRITDFGIAKAANALSERSSITRGKPAYVSPEQVLGRRVDHRSDIFSAGVVLWNALTGEQLFGGDSPEQTLQAVLQRPIVPPSTMGLRPPSCFDRVCLRALERDPDRRYQSAEQMLIDLRRIAIAEDFLAPSSDVARWVTDTFGRQLELRRQAAGISNRALGESQPISLSLAVPELGLVADAELTGETKGLPTDYGQTPSDDHSKTALIRADIVEPPKRRASSSSRGSKAASHARVFAIGAAVMFATIAIAIAIAKPEWITGSTQDPYGHYAPNNGTPRTTAAADDDGGESGGELVPPSKAGADDDGKTTDGKSDAKTDGKTDGKSDANNDAKADEGEAEPPEPGVGTATPDAKPDAKPAKSQPGDVPPVETPKKPKTDKPPKPKKPKLDPDADPQSDPIEPKPGGTPPPPEVKKKPPPPPPPPAPDPDDDPAAAIDIPGN